MLKCYRYLVIVVSDYKNMSNKTIGKFEEECVGRRETERDWWMMTVIVKSNNKWQILKLNTLLLHLGNGREKEEEGQQHSSLNGLIQNLRWWVIGNNNYPTITYCWVINCSKQQNNNKQQRHHQPTQCKCQPYQCHVKWITSWINLTHSSCIITLSANNIYCYFYNFVALFLLQSAGYTIAHIDYLYPNYRHRYFWGHLMSCYI
jgi:hypothetical protein